MMKETDDKLLITLSDVLSLFRRSKRRIWGWVFLLGALGALFALIQPIRYRAEATFREKSIKSGNNSNSLLQLLGAESLQSNQDNEANVMIKSRKMMQEVIQKLNLQATLELKCEQENIFRLVQRNLSLLWAALKNSSQPVLADHACPLQMEAVNYDGEVPLTLAIDMQANGDYEVRDEHGAQKMYGQGTLNAPFQTDQFSFILTAHNLPLKAGLFTLKLESLADTSDALCKKLQIENVKIDKGVLKLSYENRDRHQASRFINTAMQCYQDYLKTHHQQLARLQLDYLHNRQTQLANNLNELMQKHAHFLANDLFNSGFVDSDKEMDFLARSQHEYREKLLNNELEIKRLENIQPDSHVYYDSYRPHEGDSAIINNLLKEIRDLKQRRDGLEIEIQKKAALNTKNLNHSFEQQLQELKEVQQYTIELQDVIDRYHQHLAPDSSSKLVNDPRFLIKGWFERLEILEKTDPIEWQKSRESVYFYLNNLERLFNVHEKILQARLTHQQSPSGEYQGINIRVAEELYIDYSKQLIQLESTIRQNLFFIHQIEDADFEITSLSAGLNDAISQDMIKKASHLVLTIKDQSNQSNREQERLKEELNLQRTFLSLHLKQMVQLMELNKKLIDEKVYALQNVTLELMHQQISLLENTMKDYVESRLENLRQERTLIRQHLRHIHQEMGGLPKKWVAEQLIEQEVGTNQLIVEEIAKMVESKNIAHNLEVIQSAPIDEALPPVHPVTPPLILFSLLGCLVGAITGAGLVLGSALTGGLRASKDNLKLVGHHVSGSLSDDYPRLPHQSLALNDMETLRRLQSYVSILNASSAVGQGAERLLLIEGKGPDYSHDLAGLFLKNGKKVLLVRLDFNNNVQKTERGLLQYLEGFIASPTIESSPYGDVISTGGQSLHAIELLNSQSFKELLNRLQSSYDWIIGVSDASPVSVEAESLTLLFSSIAVSLDQEKVEDLAFYTHVAAEEKRKITFVLIDKQG